MSKYEAKAISFLIVSYTHLKVVVKLSDNHLVTFLGEGGGLGTPLSAGSMKGELTTDDIARLTRDTISCQFNAAGAWEGVLNINFFDGNSQLLGHFDGKGMGFGVGLGGGKGKWDQVVTDPGIAVAAAAAAAAAAGVGRP